MCCLCLCVHYAIYIRALYGKAVSYPDKQVVKSPGCLIWLRDYCLYLYIYAL